MSVPRKVIKIGLQRLDGLGEIIFVSFPCDMGDHGRVAMLKNIEVFDPQSGHRKAEFVYHNTKTGNCIYREIE